MASGNFTGANYNIGIGAFSMRGVTSGDNNIGIGAVSYTHLTLPTKA